MLILVTVARCVRTKGIPVHFIGPYRTN